MQLNWRAVPQNPLQTPRKRERTVKFWQHQGSRRREEACLIVRLCMARCERAKRSFTYNFRQAKVALPSLEHSAIVQAFRKRVPGVVSRVFEDLYSRAMLTLKLCDGKWRVWRAGRGTSRRDSIGSDIYYVAYATTRSSRRRR